MNTSENNARVAKNTIFLSLRMVFTVLLSLYTTRVVLKELGVEDYGIYNVVCGFVSMFAFLSTSMANGIQRFYNFELSRNGEKGARKVYNLSLLIQMLVAVLLIFLTETVGLWYIYNKMIINEIRFDTALCVFQMSIFSFVFVIIQVPYLSAIMAHECMEYYAVVTVFDAILKLLIAIALSLSVFSKDKLFYYGLLMTFISFLNFLLYYFYSKKKFPAEIRQEKKIDKSLLKSMLIFSGWNVFGTMGGMLRDQGVNVLLNLFFGVSLNAARGITMQVVGGLQSLVSNINVAVRPQIIKSYAQKNILRTKSLMYSLSKISFLFLFIISYPVIIENNYILKLWLGDNVPIYTSAFLNLVIIVSFINLLNSAISSVVHATGEMKMYQVLTTCISILILPVSYIWLKRGGTPISPYYITIIFTILVHIVSLQILKKLIDFYILEYLRKVILPIFFVLSIFIIIPIIPLFYFKEGLTRLIIVFSLSISCGGIFTYFIALNKSEKNIIKYSVKNIIKKIKL